ncbi:MAG: hypothetical protein JXR25_01715 [Pontiellaceae bacterium]|nr:hypothetical protein [Pontiellaceae bacterium]MBN2783517.1 hypothetical protein [Pontiellaceae bacterium]
MNLEPEILNTLLEKAITAARRAGAVIAEKTGRGVDVLTKENAPSRASAVVTEVDFMSQEAIFEVLKPTCGEFDLALLSEESPDDPARLDKDAFWCIDPMDGTLCFVEGTPGYAVSIGLTARSGAPLLGVVFNPVDLVLYHAVSGAGAFRNGAPFRVDAAADAKGMPLSLVSDQGFHDHPQFNEIMDGLGAIADDLGYGGVRANFQGGAAMCSCWVMEQAPACYFKYPKSQDGGGSLWDYAATACIMQEAGGIVSDSFRNPLDLNRNGSTYMNHCGMIYATSAPLADRIAALGRQLA